MKDPILGENSLTPSRKRILRAMAFLNAVDQERAIYPRGILGSVRESSLEPSQRAERIEMVAHQRKEVGEERKFGMLRELFVAFSSDNKLLQLAGASSNVIEVHTIVADKQPRNAIVQDKLILKRTEEKRRMDARSMYAARTPDLFVSQHWLDNMHLASGDRVIISNPRGNYEMQPPSSLHGQESPRV